MIPKKATVDRIEGREVVQVRQEAGRLDGAVEPGTGRREHRREVVHHPLGLSGHVAVDERHGLRIERKLTRGKDEAVCHDGLRIRPDRRRSPICRDDRPFAPLRHWFIPPSLTPITLSPYHPDALYSALGMSRNLGSPAGDPMNVTTWLGSTAAGARSIGLTSSAPSQEVARLLTRVLLVVALFVAAGATGLGLYAASHQGRIYQGVHVAGLDLGGLSAADARARLDAHFAEYAGRPLTLTAGDQAFQITPAEAGARLDSAATIAAAMNWGRQGSLWDQSRAWARAWCTAYR